jgi:membrane protease YdiL (CAAX protease family)
MSTKELSADPRLRFDRHDRIIWIIVVTLFWYVLVFSTMAVLIDISYVPIGEFLKKVHYMPDAYKFAYTLYLSTLPAFLGAFIYTWVTKRNRFVFRSFRPIPVGKHFRVFGLGILVGFVMNFGCILCALINGDIKLFLDFTLVQLPFYLFALICVFIQSSTEELWCRGFMYERINVRYPLWVSVAVNGVFFGLLHCFNTGVTPLSVFDICVCGVAFSLAKWYTGSIWFPAGIHTAWNFTQNFIFGLPNSGLVSEASIYKLDAASATDSLVYSVAFGVEGAFPAIVADAVLAIVILVLASRNGRLAELKERKGQPPEVVAMIEAKEAAQQSTTVE